MKKQNTKKITLFFEKIEWMFELNNFERYLVAIEKQPPEHPNLTAEVIFDMTYREITINLYPNFWDLSLALQRKALLHELVHTLIQKTKLIASDFLDGNFHSQTEIKEENEIATTKITYLLDCLLTNNLRYAKKAYKEYLKHESKPKMEGRKKKSRTSINPKDAKRTKTLRLLA